MERCQSRLIYKIYAGSYKYIKNNIKKKIYEDLFGKFVGNVKMWES